MALAGHPGCAQAVDLADVEVELAEPVAVVDECCSSISLAANRRLRTSSVSSQRRIGRSRAR